MGDGHPFFPETEAAVVEGGLNEDHKDHIDLKIRPIGRAKVSSDSALGFRKVTRRYVVEGPHASQSGINRFRIEHPPDFWIRIRTAGSGYSVNDPLVFTGGGPNASGAVGKVSAITGSGGVTAITITHGGFLYTKAPTVSISGAGGFSAQAYYEPALFRPIGEPDLEFQDHYLINQQLEPSKSIDKAYLTREYAQLRETWYAESTSESGNLRKLTRKYAVLRQDNVTLAALRHDGLPTFASGLDSKLGYSEANFQKMPVDFFREGHTFSASDSNDPWDFLPTMIDDTEPSGLQQAATAATVAGSNPLGYTGFTSQGDNSSAATGKIVFNTPPPIGVLVELTDGAGASITYAAGSSTSGSTYLADTVANAATELAGVVNSASGHGGTISAVADPDNPGTVNFTQNIKGIAGNQLIVGVLGNTATITGFSAGENTVTLVESLTTLGAPGSVDPEELKWLRASAAVDTSNPGVDLWTCSWVAPVSPFWTMGMTKGSGFTPPVIVEFDEDGPRVSSAGGGASQARSISSFTYFLTGTYLPGSFPGGGGSSAVKPVVSLDLRFVDTINHEFRITKTFTNALYKLTTSGKISFPSTDGAYGNDRIIVADRSLFDQVFRFDGDDSQSGSPASMPWKAPPHPLYQNRKLLEVGGVITWSHDYADGAAVGTTFAGATVKSIHSHKGDHVWAITVHYV